MYNPFAKKCDTCKVNRVNKRNPAIVELDTADGLATYQLCDECMAYLHLAGNQIPDDGTEDS